MNTLLYSKKHKLTEEQVSNLSTLKIKCDINMTEKEVLKVLRRMPITKRFSLTDFREPRFNCTIKPLIKIKNPDYI